MTSAEAMSVKLAAGVHGVNAGLSDSAPARTGPMDTRRRACYTKAMLRYAQPAPAFSLPSTTGREISLADYKDKKDVVLLFYCYDWGGI
jgi:hypothetical protein